MLDRWVRWVGATAVAVIAAGVALALVAAAAAGIVYAMVLVASR